MKIVVTGALGHIGSHIIRQFPARFADAKIIMIDNMMTRRFPSLFDLPTSGRYKFIEGDVTRIDLRPIFEGAHTVIHLAAMTDAVGSVDRAVQVETNNFQGTLKVAQGCLKSGARMVALSSTSVYGTQRQIVSEDCSEDELKPQSPYAKTKLKEELLLRKMALEDGLRMACCRFGTIFGVSTGMRFHTAINKFCWQAAMGQPLTVWRNSYDQKRPYLDLNDAARAIAFIIEKNLFTGQVYNIVTLNTTVRMIIETIQVYKRNVEVSFVDSPIMNQLSFEVSSQLFLDHGFSFEGDLRQGIRKTIALLSHANGF
jgi:UDP-glucose 4-epimerase